jgi:hypothetical protein
MDEVVPEDLGGVSPTGPRRSGADRFVDSRRVHPPGGSARAEYRRRLEGDRQIVRRQLRLTIPTVVLVPLGIYAGVELTITALNNWAASGFGLRTTAAVHVASTTAAVRGHEVNVLALIVAAFAAIALAKAFWVRALG